MDSSQYFCLKASQSRLLASNMDTWHIFIFKDIWKFEII